MRLTGFASAGFLAVALAACSPPPAETPRGVGFGDYQQYLREQAAREAALRARQRQVVQLPQPVRPPEEEAQSQTQTAARTPQAQPRQVQTQQPRMQTQSVAPPSEDTEVASIAEEARRAIGIETAQETPPAAVPAPAPSPQVATAPVLPVETDPSRAAISDEQSFEAVAERETIASDRARIEANRARYRVIQPGDLPPRPGNLGPNIVAYALATNNAVGQPLYRRGGLFSESRFIRNCAEYATSDQAQQAFLDRGGPERDRLGLDPDGDGFACYWDPAPFRAARQSSGGN